MSIPAGNELKERFIRETEQVIDRKRKQVEKLIAEAEEMEAEILEARELLELLKAGRLPEPEPEPVPENNGHTTKQRKMVRLKEGDLLACLQSLGRREFTPNEAAAVTGMTTQGVRGALLRLEKKGLTKEVQKAGAMVPGVGATPSKWRVTSVKH